jgi:hypothetical protein
MRGEYQTTGALAAVHAGCIRATRAENTLKLPKSSAIMLSRLDRPKFGTITLKLFLPPNKTYKDFVFRAMLENPQKRQRHGSPIRKFFELLLLDSGTVIVYFATNAYHILQKLLLASCTSSCRWFWAFLLFCAINWLAI